MLPLTISEILEFQNYLLEIGCQRREENSTWRHPTTYLAHISVIVRHFIM